MYSATSFAGPRAFARLLFVDFQTTMPPDERARLYGMDGKLRVDISLRVNEAAVEFVHEAPNGSRELLGSIVVPPAPHEPDCDCVACEPRHAAR